MNIISNKKEKLTPKQIVGIGDNRVGEIKVILLNNHDFKDDSDDNIYKILFLNNRKIVETWIISNKMKNGLNVLYDYKGNIIKESEWKDNIVVNEKFFCNGIMDKQNFYENSFLKKTVEY